MVIIRKFFFNPSHHIDQLILYKMHLWSCCHNAYFLFNWVFSKNMENSIWSKILKIQKKLIWTNFTHFERAFRKNRKKILVQFLNLTPNRPTRFSNGKLGTLGTLGAYGPTKTRYALYAWCLRKLGTLGDYENFLAFFAIF